MSSAAVVSTSSSSALHLVGLFNTWTRELSLMHSRILLDFLQLAVFLAQQMPGWWKSSVMLSVSEAGGFDLGLPQSDPKQQVSFLGPVFEFFYPQALNLFMAVFQRQLFTIYLFPNIKHKTPAPSSPSTCLF